MQRLSCVVVHRHATFLRLEGSFASFTSKRIRPCAMRGPSQVFQNNNTRQFQSHPIREQQAQTAEESLLRRDFVKVAIERLIAKDSDLDMIIKPISDDELQHGIEKFQNLLKEARACVKDCEEVSGSASAASLDSRIFEEEYKSAWDAVEGAYTSYVELLEDFRRANDQQLERYKDIRRTIVDNFKSLKKELTSLSSIQND